ncbi:hypothetical protein [Pararhizobium sp. PWRC1-1]|uniref:hypothetical protein n=1 Tax=Pararhizobium sp. PWRC1-1 TaxID=2804566 RepID=UPI003CEE1C87
MTFVLGVVLSVIAPHPMLPSANERHGVDGIERYIGITQADLDVIVVSYCCQPSWWNDMENAMSNEFVAIAVARARKRRDEARSNLSEAQAELQQQNDARISVGALAALKLQVEMYADLVAKYDVIIAAYEND